MRCDVTSMRAFVNSDTTSCEIRIFSFSAVIMLTSCASCCELFQWCSLASRRGLMISTRAFERLYVTDPMLPTMGCSGVFFLYILGVPHVQEVTFTVGIKWS